MVPQSQPDLPLRHGKPGHGVHHQVNVHALIAEVLGNGRGNESPPHPDQRQVIGGCHHHHGPPQSLRAQFLFNEIIEFPPSFSDQGDDIDIRAGIARDHPHQYALTNTRTGENPHSLPATDVRSR